MKPDTDLFRLLRSVAVLTLALTPVIHAQQFPSQQRGLNADTAYQIGDIDHINLFNGNLSLTIPIGQSYPVGPSLAFQLTLVYSSNGWDHEDAVCTDQDGTHHYSIPIQEPEANAGFGWRIQPGKLGLERDPTPALSSRSYFSPDGGEIIFTRELHPGYGNQNKTWFSTDGSYLRMRYQESGCTNSVGGSSDCYQIDFPDGTIHEFHDFSDEGSPPEERDWRVTRMFDPFGYFVELDYSTAGQWKISDSHGRSHTVFVTGDLITKVQLAAFAGTTATYELVHAESAIDRHRFATTRPTCHDTSAIPLTVNVPLLSELKQPEDTAYTMVYETVSSATQYSGSIQQLRLPTGGRFEWDYTQIDFVSQVPSAPGSQEYANISWGVSKKRSFTGSTEIGEWVYEYFTTLATSSFGSSLFEKGAGSDPNDGTPGSFQPCFHRVTVTDPEGNATVSYFDTADSDLWQYGLPFRRCEAIDGDPTQAQPPYLSQEIYQGSAEGGTKLRSIYVAYGSDGRDGGPHQAKNHRLTKRRVVYHDDDDKYREETYSSFDGLGNFREVTTSGNFQGSENRTVTTAYNGTMELVINPDDSSPGVGNTFVLPTRDTAWVLDTYSERTIDDGIDIAKQEFCFDTTSGYLERTRTLREASPSGQDIVVDLEQSVTSGWVGLERTYGGDPGSLGTGALCDLSLTTSDATTQLVHRYEYGVRKSSEYIDCDQVVMLKALDTDIDKNTGRVETSRDSAGVATHFVYDALGRRTGERPASGAWVKNTYTLPAAPSTAAPQLQVQSFVNGGETGPVLSETQYLFDGIGRLRRETLSYPDASGIGGSTRDFAYDGLDRRIKESMWEDFTLTQDSTLDRFGRVIEIDPADSNLAETIIVYTGDRLIDRTTRVATGAEGEETWVCTREEYDALGRLVGVRENRGSDPEGACAGGEGFLTIYSYDEADRLTRVCAGGGDPCGQERLFTYDNRGFLTSEQHPEVGPEGQGKIEYAYDALGNVLEKDIVDADDFSLRYRYDAANRLVGVDQVVGSESEVSRPLKSFHYARTNSADGTDKRAGKLVHAVRTNWVDIVEPLNVPGTFAIQLTQAYRYQGLDGRVSQRQTRYTFDDFHYAFNAGFAYDALGNLSSLEYPECLNAAECPPGEVPDRTVTFGYTRGYLSGISGYADAVHYQLGGMVRAIEHANGVTETITHADSNLPRPKRIATSGVAVEEPWDIGSYVYDGAGNIKQIGTQFYQYDRMNRLKRGELDLGGVTNAVQAAAYDAYGNITQLTTGGVVRATPVATGTNRLVGATYDAGGNMIAISHGSESHQYVYDAFNMMTSLRSNTDQARIFIYDAADERIVTFDCAAVACDQRSRTTYTLRDLGGRVLRIFEDEPGESFAWKRDYVYRGSQLLASVEPTADHNAERTLHLHLDHLGTPRQVTDSAGAEVSLHSYYPFGKEATSPSQDGIELKFTGHERDENGSSGAGMLDYMHARYCSPELARFASVDPARSAIPGNPQSWNRYSYGLNNPVRYTDPDGQVVETPWDYANVSLGLVSLGANVSTGNVIGAAVDVAGLLYDGFAAATPGLPAFAGSLIRGRRTAQVVSTASEAGFQVKTGLRAGAATGGGGKRYDRLARSTHASLRAAQGRRVSQAFSDVQKARPSDIFRQSDGRLVVRGPKGREHIIDRNGQLVTTIDGRSRSAHLARLREGIIEAASDADVKFLRSLTD